MKLHVKPFRELMHILDYVMPALKGEFNNWNESNEKDKLTDFVEIFWHFGVITLMAQEKIRGLMLHHQMLAVIYHCNRDLELADYKRCYEKSAEMLKNLYSCLALYFCRGRICLTHGGQSSVVNR